MKFIDVPTPEAKNLSPAKLAPRGKENHQAKSVRHRLSQLTNLGEGRDRPFRWMFRASTTSTTG